MKLTITRIWPAIAERTESKIVTACHECPWYATESDGQMTLPLCHHPNYNGGRGGYDAVLDVSTWPGRDGYDIISKSCPERLKK